MLQIIPGFKMITDQKYFYGLRMKSAKLDSNADCNSKFSIALTLIYVISCSVRFMLHAELSQNLHMQDQRSQMTVSLSPNPPPPSPSEQDIKQHDNR